MSHKKGIEAASAEIVDCENKQVVYSKAVSRIIKAYLDASGMVMLPKTATPKMIDARFNALGRGGAAEYEALISASPNPFQTPEESREKK